MALLPPATTPGCPNVSSREEHSGQSKPTVNTSETYLPLSRPQPAAHSGKARLSNRSPTSIRQHDNAAASHDKHYLRRTAPNFPSNSRLKPQSESELSIRSSFNLSEMGKPHLRWWQKVEQSQHKLPNSHQCFATSLYALWNTLITPFGLFLTIYFCNIIAWGGMAFLLIIDAAPSMCHPNCNALDSSRNDWIETNSRITVLLLATMALGFSPWRLRDLYYLLTFRISGREEGLKRLEQIHKTWLYFPNSSHQRSTSASTSNTELDFYSVPYDTTKTVLAPPRRLGRDATPPPTKLWKLEFVIYLSIANIVFQSALTSIMWAFNQYDRPAWAPVLFVSLALGTMAAKALMQFVEGRRVRRNRDKDKEIWNGVDGAEGLIRTRTQADEEIRAGIRARRRKKWTVEYYGRLWTREKRTWGVVCA